MIQALATFRRIVGLALLVAFVGGSWPKSVANAAELAPAKIVACRVGIGGQFKVGFWTPVWVDVESAESAPKLLVEVTVNDSDGVATTMPAPLPVTSSTGKLSTCLLYTRIGKIGSAIDAKLLAAGEIVDEVALTYNAKYDERRISAGLPGPS